jgi:hypothetical protein
MVCRLHFRNSGLARAHELGELTLSHVLAPTSAADPLGQGKLQFNILGFLLGKAEELTGCSNRPASGLEPCFFSIPHEFTP